jgi:hypothetical protein
MRIPLIVTSCIVAFALYACGRSSEETSTPADPSTATAVVTPEKATFTIPVGRRSTWRWNLATTPQNNREYQFEVSQTGFRSFGFSLFKLPANPPGEGNLSELIAAGQSSIWEPNPDGGGHMAGAIRITPVRQDSALELVIVEEPILKDFLATRPPVVEVVTRTPDSEQQRYSVAVKYEDR